MQDFRELKAWQKAHRAALDVYRVSARFSVDERFGLTSQMRRAAVSVGANLAEGCGRGSDADFARFAQIAFGSASELEYLVLLGRDLNEMREDEANQLFAQISEVKRMVTALIRTLRS